MAKKANARLAILSRVLGKFPINSFPGIHGALIRPLTETNIQICSPFLAKDIKQLESVQRRATKRVSGLHLLPYDQRLSKLNLFSLVYRRARGDLILTFKILKTENHPNRDVFKEAHSTKLRGHHLKLYIQPSRLQCRHHSFALRVCPLWNALPPDIISVSTVDHFKRRLDEWLLPR